MKKSFESQLADHLEAFLLMKLSCGYRYVAETSELRRLDRYLHANACPPDRIDRDLAERWVRLRKHERPRTMRARMSMFIQFAKYARRHGVAAYLPDSKLATTATQLDFVPYIFTHQQIHSLLTRVDGLASDPRSPERHLVMPELFRLLCYCGLRVSEACNLTAEDVDAEAGVLRILDTKFRKNRLVPVAPSIRDRLRTYKQRMAFHRESDPFFPTARNKPFHQRSIYGLFRRFLNECGIPHGGRGKGPRLHDLRHTFAVHCLERWYRDGQDINTRLPLLVTYLGHSTLSGTQRYLQLTPAIFPDINGRLNHWFNDQVSKEAAQ
ncbi:Tyrosine recombinase XerD [Stieleria bergensis]|uniref:Tyrosine recombinase XerD n=1 Tax=Stieleria bergensis TaxID=2528025 RepID=A0A517T1Z3_9BACT|nr:Tyrosine recombinase XerD [Planctomycetes bacterium SV_7m_r]